MAEITKQALKVENNTEFPNNNNGQIKPTNLRSFNEDMIDSTVNQTGYNVDSGSWNASIQALNNYTASVIPINTGSLLTTASFDNGTRNLTFTKGDASTFNVNIPDVSGSIIDTGSLMVTGSVSGNTLTFTKGDESQFSLTVETGSSGTGNGFPFSGSAEITGSLSVSKTITSQIYINPQTISGSLTIPTGNNAMLVGPVSVDGTITIEGTSRLIVLDEITGSALPSGLLSSSVTNFETYSASVDTRINSITGSGGTINTGSFATTGSNIFIGNQTITGSLSVSSSVDRIVLVGPNISNFDPGSIGGVYVSNSFSVGGDVRFDSAVRFGQLEVSKIVGKAASTLPGGGGQLNIITNVQLFDDSNVSNPRYVSLSGSADVSQSLQVGTALKLKSNDPLPTGSIGDLAVSGSSLYFYNGAWTLVV
jgi:hypothetical protein